MKQFRPLGDRVLVRPTKVEESKSSGGIIIADSMNRDQKLYGEVVEIGTGIFSQSGERIPMTVSVGDTIVYEKSQATNEIEVDGEKLILFNEHQLIGIVK